MFLQRKGQVIMTIELLDTEEAQTEDPVEVQVRTIALGSLPCACWGAGGSHEQHHGAPTSRASCVSTGHALSMRT